MKKIVLGAWPVLRSICVGGWLVVGKDPAPPTGNAFYSVCVALWTGTAAAKETSNVNPPDRALVIPVPANAEKGFMVLESRDATK